MVVEQKKSKTNALNKDREVSKRGPVWSDEILLILNLFLALACFFFSESVICFVFFHDGRKKLNANDVILLAAGATHAHSHISVFVWVDVLRLKRDTVGMADITRLESRRPRARESRSQLWRPTAGC